MSKLKKIIQITILIAIIIVGIFMVANNEVLAKKVEGTESGWLFSDDLNNETLNWDYIPSNLFAEEGIILWCMEQGTGTHRFMTAAEAFDDAAEYNTTGYTYGGEVSWVTGRGGYYISTVTGTVYAHYTKTDSLGFIRNHETTAYGVSAANTYNYHKSIWSRLGCHTRSFSEYEGDDQDIIDLITASNGLPGVGGPIVYSINYRASGALSEEENQAALFILTALHKYPPGETSLYAETLTQEELEEGGFNVVEKQYGLWEVLNIGNPVSTDYDRGAGEIAAAYQEFYDAIHNGSEDIYEEYVEAFNGYDENGNRVTDNVEETVEEIDGEEYKTFVYNDTIVEIDNSADAYVLGPFAIDYTIDDDTLDTYYTLGTYYSNVADRSDEEAIDPDAEDETEIVESYEIKFNAIQNVTVYNQDKIDITTLGGYFKLAYSYNGTLDDEAKITRINNETYVTEDTILDGEEITGVESLEEFYIIIYRGDMEPEDFTGFYAKFDFEYLESITGSLEVYVGYVYQYYYEENDLGVYTHTYEGTYYVEDSYCPDYVEVCTAHHHSSKEYEATISIEGKTYDLVKEDTGTKAQQHVGYANDGERIYKKYSIIITSDWSYEDEPPGIEIYKECSTDGEALYGAEFEITLNISGTDIYDNEVEEVLEFTRITDSKGKASITDEDIQAKGVYLGYFTGTVEATFVETAAPANHAAAQETTTMIITIEDGVITGVSSSNPTSVTDNVAQITIYNTESGTPKIQIAKVDANNNLIEEAYFEIQVAYTDPDGVVLSTDGTSIIQYGELIDVKSNVIRGQTNGGVLNLTVEDFLNLKSGFDITNYSGKITLDIIEVYVDGAFSISTDSKDITLEYINGVLVDYTEYTDSKVVVQYLYDSVKDNIYQYATGQIAFNDLHSYVQEFLTDWVGRQQENTDLSYDDILAWLVEYIEENDDDIMRVTTTLTTDMLSDKNGDIVQVVVEDSIGELPDIPDEEEEEPDPLFITIAGTVFLDQTTTKAYENESNGYLDQGEQLLYGIEVALYEVDGTLAELVQKEGEIRTNPTMTDENGYYQFKGVDPFKEYYVVFKYNGIEYETTVSSEEEYNSDAWAISSKGSELTSDRSSLSSAYSEIGSTTIAYDYYLIEGIYTEIATRVHEYINNNGSYPDMESIYSAVISNHSDDEEIEKKIEYIKSSMIEAYAGYSSVDGGISSETANGTYPYYYGERFIINESLMNSSTDEIEFAGDTVKLLYPGQLQVNLGLVERDSTDLSLLTDIVQTTVSMNGYDTTYELNQGLSSYNQYIYEEDYNYSTTENTDGVAYYTDDEVEFYMTYKITITNETLTDTALVEVVDYYNDKFSWASSYTTSKGNTLAGYSISFNGTDITSYASISNSSRYGLTDINNQNTSYVNSYGDSYKALFITFNTARYMTDGDVLEIQLTFKMDEASANLYNKIWTEKGSSDYSKLWEIGNYAEINGYMTREGYLDSDSRPGNFVIEDYEVAKAEYQEAYSNYVSNRTDDNARMLKLALGRFTDIREDDAWYVGLTLANSGYVRELHGSVWEAITDEVTSASNLQNYNGLLTYIEANGLEGLRVELVELCDDGQQIVRGKNTTGANGDYQFTSYIAGNYVVRFIYGEEDKDVRGQTTNSVDETLQVNGQYYQSTKANDQTDSTMYWYDSDQDTRYSDAYDDAKSRIDQINATIANTEAPSTSSDYEYDGVIEVQSYNHKDTIYAYTSTLNLEIEYVSPEIEGNRENEFYEYKVVNIDFGLTPRAIADLNIDKYVSNIKIYLQDGTLQLDAYIDADGDVTYLNDDIYTNVVLPNYSSNAYLDGLIETLFDEQLLNGATVEVTYTITVSNEGEEDTIKYIYSQGRTEPVAVAYYGEDYTALTSYEGDRGAGTIVYHEGNASTYSLEIYSSGNDERFQIYTSATNIVDYIDPSVTFIQTNKAGEEVNRDWELTSTDDFNSSREANVDVMSQYNTIIRATDESALYTALLPERTATTTLTLSVVLATTSTETNDYEYSNLIEITKVHNDAGKVIDIEGYDIEGSMDTETSKNRPITDLSDPIYPTIGTSKSETIVIHEPTGLTVLENYASNLIIVLMVLVIFAVGIVLIKKFVLKPRTE